ncbi:MAG: hypothetical protein AAF682_23700 [Planctomycetota bacterium]
MTSLTIRAALGAALLTTGVDAASVQEPEPAESQLLSLLVAQTDDPDVRFLCLIFLSLDDHRELAAEVPQPLYVAALVSKLSSQSSFDEDLRAELVSLCTAWEKAERGNGFPMLIRANAALQDGELDEGLLLLEQASLRTYVDDWNARSLAARWTTLNEHGIEDVACFPAILQRNLGLTNQLIDAALVLSLHGDECRHRGRLAEAQRCDGILERLGSKYESRCTDWVAGLTAEFVSGLAAWGALETSLMRGDAEAAKRAAALGDASLQRTEVYELAKERAEAVDPLYKAAAELDFGIGEFLGGLWGGLVRAASEEEEAADRQLDQRAKSGLARLLKRASRDQLALESRLRANEAEVRAHFEALVRDGELGLFLSYLTEEEHAEVSQLRSMQRHLYELREEFYPSVYGEEHRQGLVERILSDPEELPVEQQDLASYLRGVAIRALIHHGDRDARPLLRSGFDELDGLRAADVALVLSCLGAGDASLAEPLLEWVGIFSLAGYRGVACLGKRELVKPLLETLGEYPDVDEGIAAAFALADLTGEDFGLDFDRWRRWADEHLGD